MVEFKRVSKSDLFDRLAEWDLAITKRVLVVACGGTALTLQGYKPSTLDIDFVVPRTDEHDYLKDVLERKLGYSETDAGFRDPSQVYRFDLFRGNRVFQTELLDRVDRSDRHEVVHQGVWLTVGVLNPYDLIISKMFRGDDVDVQDSIVMIAAEMLDQKYLADRYRETAQYDTNEPKCRRNLGYLVQAMQEKQLDHDPLKELLMSWNPM